VQTIVVLETKGLVVHIMSLNCRDYQLASAIQKT